MSGLPDHIPSSVIAAFLINCIVLILLLGALSVLLWIVLTKGRPQFPALLTTMIRIRRRMKKSQLTLDEFLKLCRNLGISCEEVTATYKIMHTNRRNTGEYWLFGEPISSEGKKSPISGGKLTKSTVCGVKGQRKGSPSSMDPALRRNIPIFRDFAQCSQFTQGHDGYLMHRLLHTFRPCEYQSPDSPEAATEYQLTDMCSTLRRGDVSLAPSLDSVSKMSFMALLKTVKSIPKKADDQKMSEVPKKTEMAKVTKVSKKAETPKKAGIPGKSLVLSKAEASKKVQISKKQ